MHRVSNQAIREVDHRIRGRSSWPQYLWPKTSETLLQSGPKTLFKLLFLNNITCFRIEIYFDFLLFPVLIGFPTVDLVALVVDFEFYD